VLHKYSITFDYNNACEISGMRLADDVKTEVVEASPDRARPIVRVPELVEESLAWLLPVIDDHRSSGTSALTLHVQNHVLTSRVGYEEHLLFLSAMKHNSISQNVFL